MSIGIIGVGLPGTAIAQRPLQRGFPVIGYDLAEERRAMLRQLGGVAALSAKEVAHRCDASSSVSPIRR